MERFNKKEEEEQRQKSAEKIRNAIREQLNMFPQPPKPSEAFDMLAQSFMHKSHKQS